MTPSRRPITPDFPSALRIALHRRAMSQRELASNINVSKNTVTSWATGAHEPGLGHVRRIADALDMTVAELLGEPATQRPAADDLIKRLASVAPDLMTLLEEAQRRVRP